MRLLVVFYTILLTILCILGAHNALSDDWSLRGGAAVTNSQINGGSKIFGFRHEASLIYGLYTGEEVGGYVDHVGDGREGAAFGKLQLGVKPGPETGVFGKLFTGPCYITNTDNYLSSNLQFCTDFGIGIRDYWSFVDVTYSHVSNAGIKLPNRGKDYVVFEAGLRFE